MKNLIINKSYRSVSNGNKFVSDCDSTVNVGCTALHNFGDVDAIISWNVLIADTSGDTESQTFVPFRKFNFE